MTKLLGDLRTPADASPTMKRLKESVVIERASYRSLLEIALRVTTAQEMTLVVAEGPVYNREGFEALLGKIEWAFFLKQGDSVGVRVESHDSVLYHEGLLRECIGSALVAADAQAVPPSREEPDHRIRVHVSHDLCRVELSLVGEPMWKRGYRSELTAVAPFREDLAQAVIRTSLRDAGLESAPPPRLLLPFAGSGTFLFEYLIAVLKIPPFLFRKDYAFERFSAGTPPSADWIRRKLVQELDARAGSEGSPPIRAVLVERSPQAVDAIRNNLERFESSLASAGRYTVGLSTADVFTRPWAAWLPAGEEGVFLPLNPPYGMRLPTSSTETLYGRIGHACAELASAVHPAPLAGFVLCPSETSWRRFLDGSGGLSRRTRHVSQGGIDLRVCTFRS